MHTDYAYRTIREIREDTDYHPEREGSVDELIEYKDTIEGRLMEALSALDRISKATAGSAADCCEVVYAELVDLQLKVYEDRGELEAYELADEFEENGLGDVAEHLREHGIETTRPAVDALIADAAANDDPEGWRLGNLEVARDRLAGV